MSAGLGSSLPQAVVIVLLSLGAGLAGNRLSPWGIPLITPPKPPAQVAEFIPIKQAERLWHSGTAFFLDARAPADYAAGHIGNALNLPVQSFPQYFGAVAPMLTPNSDLVLYCDGVECELSHRLRDNLRQLGYTNTHLLFNGWTAWRQAGLPSSGGSSL